MEEIDRWANIVHDMLDEIARLMYCYDDYVRLRLVCKQWNLSLQQTPNHNYPWLVLPFDENSSNSTHDLYEKQIYHLRLCDMRNGFIRGSSYGYLIIVMESGTVGMLNPFTKSHFDLPLISTFPRVIGYDANKDEFILRRSRNQGLSYLMKKSFLHKVQLEKIVTSSPPNHHEDFMAVAIYSGGRRLAYCRLGDSKWIDMHTDRNMCRFQDVTFHEGKIYAIDRNAGLHEFDVKNGVPLRGFEITQLTPPPDCVPNINHRHLYLLSSPNGALLMVTRILDCFVDFEIPQRSCYWTHKLNVHVLNNDENKKPIWSRFNSLGKYALILGFSSFSWMLPDTSSKREENQIYYTDNIVRYHRAYLNDLDLAAIIGGNDIGIFDLENRINNRMFPNLTLVYPPPIWLLPVDVS